MKSEKIFQKNKNLVILAIIILCFSILFLPFFHVIAAAIITAYFAYPLFSRLHQKVWIIPSIATTWGAILLVIIIPLSIISGIIFFQSKQIVKDSASIPTKLNQIISSPNTTKYLSIIEGYAFEYEDQVNEILASIAKKANTIGEWVLLKMGNFAKELPFFIVKIIMYIFITNSLLLNGKKILAILSYFSPVESNVTLMYLEKVKHMTNGIMIGNFAVAGIQAIITTISFMLVGIPYAGFVLLISFILYIPMIGTSILYIPATIFFLVQGNYAAALFVFLINSVLVANIDNVFRGHFVPKEARINNTLMFISILSGILLFGVMGVLYGPLIAIIWVTSINLYIELRQGKKKV